MLLIPTLPLNLAAGVFWGALWGGVIAMAGAVAGSISAFALARWLIGQPLAKRFGHQHLLNLQKDLDAKGWRLIAFARLNPAFPTGPINYLLGLTSVNSSTYVWSTAVFLSPPTVLIALAGHSFGSYVANGTPDQILRPLLIVSSAMTVPVLAWYGYRVLNRNKSR
ncbi:MAG: TVP38/TMEM64 family protein [Acidiferrobacter thiooxydans]